MNFSATLFGSGSSLPQLKQLFKIMKLCILLLIIGLLQARAEGFSQVTLNERHSSLAQVIRKIEKQTPYSFIYDEEKLKLPTIDVKVTNVSVNRALDACFKGLPVSYSIVGNNIILKPSSQGILDKVRSIFEGPISVRGIVKDTAGMPLYKATIFFVKQRPGKNAPNGYENSRTISYVTGQDGVFSMDAEEGDELGVSYLGYQTHLFRVEKDMPYQTIILRSLTA